MASLHMALHGLIWICIRPEFWMLIEQNPDMEYNLIAVALADDITRLKHQWFYEKKNYVMRT
eukprot:2699617-Prorocentrum_lima.AAC.1